MIWPRIRQIALVEWGHWVLRRPDGAVQAERLLSRLAPVSLTPRYLALVRRVRGQHHPFAHLWRLVIQGEARSLASAPAPAIGFYRHYMVVADTPNHALRILAAIEPEASWADLSIDTQEDCGPSASCVTGVVEASGPVWYGPTAAEDQMPER